MAIQMYLCTESFWANIRGTAELFTAGKTLVSGDSEAYRRFPQHFRPAEESVRSDVEQATRAPGEKRHTKV